MKKRSHPDLRSSRHNALYHARRAVGNLGAAGILSIFEIQNTDRFATVVGAASIAAFTGKAIHHTIQYFSLQRRNKQPLSRFAQFQYNDPGASERYCAEVEYLSTRLASRLREEGVSNLSDVDIDPLTRSDKLSQIGMEMFTTRLNEGYELSLRQMSAGFYGAGRALEAAAVS